MPLITIAALPSLKPTMIFKLITDVRDSGAAALECTPSNIWVIFQEIPSGFYVQGEVAATHLQKASHPPIVTIKAQSGRSEEQRNALAGAVAAAIGRGLSIPAENVWIQYIEMKPQDVWFEGRWSG